jgi:hypothetical protein
MLKSIGLNANLRTTVIYDILGLNWSDDCSFAYNSFAQGLGILGGLPIAGRLKLFLLYEDFVLFLN